MLKIQSSLGGLSWMGSFSYLLWRGGEKDANMQACLLPWPTPTTCQPLLQSLPSSSFLMLGTASWSQGQLTPRCMSTTWPWRRRSTCLETTQTGWNASPRRPCGPTRSGALLRMGLSGEGLRQGVGRGAPLLLLLVGSPLPSALLLPPTDLAPSLPHRSSLNDRPSPVIKEQIQWEHLLTLFFTSLTSYPLLSYTSLLASSPPHTQSASSVLSPVLFPWPGFPSPGSLSTLSYPKDTA